MPELPSPHAAALLAITGAVFVLFAQGRIRIEVVCLSLIAVLALGFYFFPFEQSGKFTGIEVAFGGFGHEALVAICCLMILGRGLVVTGALEPAARVMARLWRFNRGIGMMCTLVLCMTLSAFVNDTPILVLTLPVLLSLVTRANVPASKTLMPVNAAILIGGMATAIGTSTNILVLSIAEDMGVAPIGVFSFSGVAVMAGAVAFPYLWLVMPRLLPAHTGGRDTSTRQYRSLLNLTAASVGEGQAIEKVLKRVGGMVQISEVVREGRPLSAADPEFIVGPGDGLRLQGTMFDLREASEVLKAPLADPDVIETVADDAARRMQDQQLAELVVGPDSPLVGQTVRGARIGERFGLAVLGNYRSDLTLHAGPGDAAGDRLQVGDLLLVQGTPDRLREIETSQQVLLVGRAQDLPRTAKASIAVVIVASVVLLAAFKLVPIAIAALAGTIAMLLTRCVLFERLGRALSAEVIVLVAAAIALGRALVETGAADWLATVFAFVLGRPDPAVVLVAILAFAAFLTNFVSNAAAAAVGTPLAVSLSRELGLPAEPMVLAVLFGANLCYVTPVAYQTNLLIRGPGGYRFQDYVRAGLPLALLMIATLAILLVQRYRL